MTPEVSESLLQDARLSWHPEDWLLKRLGEVCHVRNHLRKPLSDAERQQMQGQYPYFGPTCQVDSISEYRLDGVYTLIGEDGDHFLKYDRMSMTQLIAGKSNVNNHAHILEGSDSCCTEWLFHFFRHRNIVHFLSRQGAGRFKLNKQTLLRLPVLVPPMLEQKRIAAILMTWDRAIELTERLIAAKQKRKASLMQSLLTGTLRFQRFVMSESRHQTPVGEMPTDWRIVRLDKLLTKVKRKNAGGETHVLTASGEHGLVDQTDFFNRSVAGKDLSGYYLLKRGEFAYNRSAMKGYPFGAIKRLELYEQGVLSTLYICFGLADVASDSDFIAHYFEARLLDRQLGEVTQVGGRAHGLLNITDSDFYSMHVVLPPLDEQKAIAAVLNTQDREIELHQKKLDALRRQKKGLMQQLLTGTVRVDVTGASGE